MANQQHLALLKQSIEDWNEWRQTHHEIQPDLSGADLKGARLQRIDLSHAYLNNADLSNAWLKGTDLRDANMQNTLITQKQIKDTKKAEQ